MAGDAVFKSGRHAEDDVSIHTRHEWRVMPSAPIAVCAIDLFQSTPAMNGG